MRKKKQNTMKIMKKIIGEEKYIKIIKESIKGQKKIIIKNI